MSSTRTGNRRTGTRSRRNPARIAGARFRRGRADLRELLRPSAPHRLSPAIGLASLSPRPAHQFKKAVLCLRRSAMRPASLCPRACPSRHDIPASQRRHVARRAQSTIRFAAARSAPLTLDHAPPDKRAVVSIERRIEPRALAPAAFALLGCRSRPWARSPAARCAALRASVRLTTAASPT